ncbi:MAG: extracellular solute-binding protein [Chloroflexi bacterium]|nr:extracellular solute-binding protein [Chloroflexota bacterium]
MKLMKSMLVFIIVAVIAASNAHFTAAQDKPFEGVTVELLTFTGPQVAEPLQRRAPDFAELTGAKVNITTVPNSDLYQTMLTDLATGTNSYDAFLFAPQWIVDFAVPGYIEDLTPYVENDSALEWDDIAPFFRDFSATFEGKVYSIPLDGDFHMVYYRSDVLAAAGLEPPRTWDDYLAVAAALNGTDMNGDGEGDYGSCISKARSQQSYWWIISIAAPYIQSKGTSQGAFFNTDNMEPLVNNPGFIRALEVYKETNKYGPPNELTANVGDTRSLFITGRCALTLDWGDIGSLAVDPEQSVVQDKVGSIVTPGSTEVLDWETGELVACDETTCPYAIDGVNYAPFASFGGWAGSVNAASDQKVKDAAYAFFSYMSQPAQANEDVTIGRTGYNPYRISQFENLDRWLENGFSEAAAIDYLGAIEASLNNPNMVLDLRIPQNQRYEQVSLDLVLSQFLAGEFNAEEAAQEIYDRWDEITEELGRDDQLNAYRATIGAE